MNVEELLAELSRLGIRLWTEDGRLLFRAPRGAMNDALRERIRELKPTLIAMLGAAPPHSSVVAADGSGTQGSEPTVLSFAQQRLWFLDQLEPGSAWYNVPSAFMISGPLDGAALQAALDTVVSRHDSLRTVFVSDGEEPMQLVHSALRVPLTFADLDGISGADRDDALQARLRDEAFRPFDLARGPLLRALLLRLGEERHVLMLNMHHIVSDGWSKAVLHRELSGGYGAALNGVEPELPALGMQYADYALWQRRHLQGDTLEHQLDYWRAKLADVPPLDLPTDKPRPDYLGSEGSAVRFELSPELSSALVKLGISQGATSFMLLLAAFSVLLSRYSGQRDIAIGAPIAGRTRASLENLIGFFVNTLVMRTDLSGDPTFLEVLRRVRDTALQAYDHQDLPFERLVEELAPARDTSRNPVFQVMFAFQNMPENPLQLHGLEVSPLSLERTDEKFDLSLTVRGGTEGMQGCFSYNCDLFQTETIERMLAQLRVLLEGIVANPAEAIDNLPVLPIEEKNRLLDDWNQTGTEHEEQDVVHELVAQQAVRRPDAIAIEFNKQSCTYAELEARSNQLARHLQSLGVSAGSAVGVYIERSIDMVIGLLAIWKAGGYYVPLDPSFPLDRLAFMSKDAGLDLLLSHSSLQQQLPLLGEMPALLLDVDIRKINTYSADALEYSATPDSLAYVIYTSGSTGQPKGVPIQQRALANFLHAMAVEPGIESTDRLLAVTTLSFDIAGLELYLPLISGACLLLASREEALDARQLADRIVSSEVSIMQATPATWRMLIDSQWSGAPGLKILCGGESLPRELADLLLVRCKELWNMYGPTETTIWSLVKRIEERDSGPILVGRPIANTTLYILDKYLQPLPIGATGELLIGGEGLATGYHGREELTADRFIQHPFLPRERLYRTGDLSRYRADGQVEILGRIDHQVKVRGFRIELGEIESILNKFPSLEQALVVAREDLTGKKTLVAYYQSKADRFNTSDLRAQLKQSLPDYMIPSFFMKLDSYPLTPNGKIDRKALPAPDGSQRELEQDYVVPTTDIQIKLAALWAEVLGLKRVGIQDNFFDLGGHSLLALRLVAKMEREVGISLPLIALFQGRTIEDITAEGHGIEEVVPSALVAIREQGSLAPFFAIGSHPRFVDVARRVDSRRPFYRLDVYALQSNRMAQGEKIYKNVEELLIEFVDSIQAVQPTGPYYLGGGCEGALAAFAVASELQRRGEEVVKLILWITPAPHYGNGAVFGKMAIFRVMDQMKTLARHLQVADINLRTLLEIVKHKYIEFRIFRAMDKYSPTQKFDGEIIVARTVENRKSWDTDLAMGWGELATGGSKVHKLPGNHDNWLADYAGQFGDFLDSCLREQPID